MEEEKLETLHIKIAQKLGSTKTHIALEGTYTKNETIYSGINGILYTSRDKK